MRRTRSLLLLAALSAALVTPSAVVITGSSAAPPDRSIVDASAVRHLMSPTLPAGSNAVVRWNAYAGDAALMTGLAPTNNPLHESRMYAMMHLAIHDALNAIQHRYRPYAFHGHARNASPKAAIASAARTVLVNALGQLPAPFSDGSATAISGVEAGYTAELASVPDGMAKRKGIALGRAAAYTILADRADDGSDTLLFATDYPQGDQPGEYRKTPGFDFAFAPEWGDVDPFVRGSKRFPVEPPFALGSRKYAKDLNEVKRLGGDGVTTPSARTPDETEAARFWVESSPLLWNRVGRQLATNKHLGLWRSARLFGLLDMALTDGYIATFKVKYDLLFWRPVTAIQLAGTDGNVNTVADPTWTPLVPTPPIPDHDSGHSVEGGAAAAVFRGFFKTDRMRFSTCSYTMTSGSNCNEPQEVIRHFTSFSQAAGENARSRVLVGFHFTHATTVGTRHGGQIGDLTVLRYLERNHHHHR